MGSDTSLDEFEIVTRMVADEKMDLSAIKNWLSPTDYLASSSEFNRHASSKAPELGEWIRETSQFNQWHESVDHGSLWIKAVPGAGKSVLAASMVQSLLAQESVPVLFFFFRQIVETNRSSRALLRDWMCQLLPFSEVLQLCLGEHVEGNMSLDSISTEQLWKELLEGLKSLERVYCIVDALDEMDMDEDFLGRLNSLGSFRPAQIKVLITSQPKQYLTRALRDPRVVHFNLDQELVKRDLFVFVRQRVKKFAMDGINENIRVFIQNTIFERSKGLFLYARLMLDQIGQSIREKKHDESSIREMVAELPLGLEKMYNRVLFDHASLTNVHQDIQVLILQLVTHSVRPMRLSEIAKAIETNPHFLNSSRESEDIVRSSCGPLLEIMKDEVVQILHHSFTEFLLDVNRSARTASDFPQFPVINSKEAHREIVLLCLGQLQGGAFDTYPVSDDTEGDESKASGGIGGPSRQPEFDFLKSFVQYPLLEYAVTKWTHHAKKYDFEDPHFYEALEEFCKPHNPAFKAWSKWVGFGGGATDVQHSLRQFNSSVASEKATPLHIAAGFGLSCWMERLLKNGANAEILDVTKHSPLFWACKGGHTEVVKKLLDFGAKPNVGGSDGTKPLHIAASKNHAEIVKLLLVAGVSPLTPKSTDTQRSSGKEQSNVDHHPLMLASNTGHVETVVEMIPYCQIGDLEMALIRSARLGHHGLVSILLEKTEVSPNAKFPVKEQYDNMEGQTPLICATSSLEPSCVQILLEKGAAVDTKSTSMNDLNTVDYCKRLLRYGPESGFLPARTPLHTLAMAPHIKKKQAAAKKILDMILAAGADLEARDAHGDTPLLLTLSSNSHEFDPTAIELLLSAGADPCATSSNGDTLLHRACEKLSSTDLANQLLTFGADPNQARASDGLTPLHCAVDNTRKPDEHIKLLISHGADINARDLNGDTPLHRAFRSDYSVDCVISVLLSFQPDLNIQNNLGETCLHNISGRPGWLNSVIDGGIDLEICDRDGMSVLLRAVAEPSDLETVETLLKHPRKPSITSRTWLQGKTALHLACHSEDALELVKLLVNHGADLNWIDNMNGNTLLHEAAALFNGDERVIALVEYLVENGVSINAKNYRQQTAAHIMGPFHNHCTEKVPSANRYTFISVIRRLCPEFDVNVRDMGGYTPLHYACATSELSALVLMKAGADLNAKAFNQCTPLHYAARGRQCGIISMLINQDAASILDLNAQDSDGLAPLHYACISGRPESVSILISAGAEVDEKVKHGITPLVACAKFPEEDMIWKLLQKGELTELNMRDPFRVPPSSLSAHYHTDALQYKTCRIGVIAEMLIRAGADTKAAFYPALNAKCAELVHVIRGDESAKSKNFDEIKLMGPILNLPKALDELTDEALYDLKRGIPDLDGIIMKHLIARGVDFTKRDRENIFHPEPAIIKLAQYGFTEIMKEIISSVKLFDDPEFTKPLAESVPNGWSIIRPLLQVACQRPIWNMDMVRLLVEEGHVNVNAHHKIKEKKNHIETGNVIQGTTALHILAEGNFWWQVEALEYLVKNGADVDILDENGHTPLEVAIILNENRTGSNRKFFGPQCCENLLKLGADPNKIDSEGITALNRAGSDEEIIGILLKYGADVNAGTKGISSAIESGDVKIVQLYLENGADPNMPDSSTDSSYRARYESPKVAKKFPILVAGLSKGSSADFGSISATVDMIQLLLDHGARVDLAIDDNESVLHYLFANATSAILHPLIERPGIDMNSRDQSGRTVLLAAIKNPTIMEGQYGYVSGEDHDRLKAEYKPPIIHLLKSAIHGPSLAYLAVDHEGRHIIFYLISRWNDEIASLIFSIPGIRSLVNQKDNAGYTPLHPVLALSARSNPRNKIIYKLLEEGADLLEPDPKSDTALHYLCHNIGHSDCEFTDSLPLMNRYLALGGDINARNDIGMTPLLTYLAAEGHKSALPWFKEHAADFKAKNNEGEGALHIVAKRRLDRSSPFLWHQAIKEGDPNATLFEMLVEKYGCEVSDEDWKGRTALDVAAAVGNRDILKLVRGIV